MIKIKKIDASGVAFQKSFKKLPKNIQEEAREAIKGLLKEPIPKKYRFEKLNGYKNPNVYTIHVTRNHSHKLSFEVLRGVAILRFVGTHKKIDITP